MLICFLPIFFAKRGTITEEEKKRGKEDSEGKKVAQLAENVRAGEGDARSDYIMYYTD